MLKRGRDACKQSFVFKPLNKQIRGNVTVGIATVNIILLLELSFYLLNTIINNLI